MKKLLCILLSLTAAMSVGCLDGGESSTGFTWTSTWSECPQDPADGPVPPQCGVWVSAGLGFDGNPGLQNLPVRTLSRAIELAAQGSGQVYACNETWYETLKVPGTVSLHGGFDCFHDWEYVGAPDKQATLTPVSTFGITWVEEDPNNKDLHTPFLTDFHIEALGATEPGGSSIGVFVRDDIALTVRHCTIVVGDGADGADGEPGSPDGQDAEDGEDGTAGADACSAVVSQGGVGPSHTCSTGLSKGGDGGDGGTMIASNGEDGLPDSPGSMGLGGLGEQFAPKCTEGQYAQPGAKGYEGGGAILQDARMSTEGYIGGRGQDGGTGQPGRGGGGGGATFGSTAVCGAATPGGAAGGSGGSGGCGGKGGKGGQGGGSSIGVALNGHSESLGYVLIQACRIVTGNGGHGGNGGPPQEGGYPGQPGPGGKGSGTIPAGCPGGWGGFGGRGGWGGGGMGGYSLCIGTKGWAGGQYIPQSDAIDCVLGTAGNGGIGDPMGGEGGAQNAFASDRGIIGQMEKEM